MPGSRHYRVELVSFFDTYSTRYAAVPGMPEMPGGGVRAECRVRPLPGPAPCRTDAIGARAGRAKLPYLPMAVKIFSADF